jgi:hypothetical protein
MSLAATTSISTNGAISRNLFSAGGRIWADITSEAVMRTRPSIV